MARATDVERRKPEAGRRRELPEAMRLVLGIPAGLAFGAVAVVRRARALHPAGAAFAADLVLDGPGAVALPDVGAPGARRPGVVRFSRGGGLPEGWPDIHGVALRLAPRHEDGRPQDLLLSTSGTSVVGRRLLVPVRSLAGARLSSLTSFRAGGRRVVFGAHVEHRAPPGVELTVERLRTHPDAAPTVALELAPARGGPWERVGTIRPGGPIPPAAEERLAFSPWNDGDGIAPVGVLNLLRDAAYRASRLGRRLRPPES